MKGAHDLRKKFLVSCNSLNKYLVLVHCLTHTLAVCVCYWSSTNSLQRAVATAAFTAKDSVLREVTVNQNNKTAEQVLQISYKSKEMVVNNERVIQ